jgi:hypothetical protein
VLFVVFAPKQVGPRIGRVIYNKIGYGSDVDIQDLSGTGMALKPPPPPPLPPPSPLPCDVNRDGGFTILDVHSLVNQILGVALPTSDVNGDSIVNVIDLQRVVNAVLGLGCNSTL